MLSCAIFRFSVLWIDATAQWRSGWLSGSEFAFATVTALHLPSPKLPTPIVLPVYGYLQRSLRWWRPQYWLDVSWCSDSHHVGKCQNLCYQIFMFSTTSAYLPHLNFVASSTLWHHQFFLLHRCFEKILFYFADDSIFEITVEISAPQVYPRYGITNVGKFKWWHSHTIVWAGTPSSLKVWYRLIVEISAKHHKDLDTRPFSAYLNPLLLPSRWTSRCFPSWSLDALSSLSWFWVCFCAVSSRDTRCMLSRVYLYIYLVKPSKLSSRPWRFLIS